MVGIKGRSGRKGVDRKPLAWPKGYDLRTRENWIAFITHFIRKLWENNALDARTGGCINNALRLLGDGMGWITKAPLQIIQAQVMQPGTITEADLAELLSELPEDERRKLWEKAKERRLRNAVSRPGQS
jgi:hypothetical protein